MLEVIDNGSCSDAHPVPLLFVHGGWHSASCWDNFLDFFADAGYRAVAREPARTRHQPHREAVSRMLHGRLHRRRPCHGRQPGRPSGAHRPFPGRLRRAAIPRRPTVRQPLSWWRRCRRRACSDWQCACGAATRGSLCGRCRSATWPGSSVPRRWSASTSSARTHQTTSWNPARRSLQAEAIRASLIDPLLRRVRSKRVTTPMLVLGAEHDGLVTPRRGARHGARLPDRTGILSRHGAQHDARTRMG